MYMSAEKWPIINLRISHEMLETVDQIVFTRAGITRTGWILEAIQEKIKQANPNLHIHSLVIEPKHEDIPISLPKISKNYITVRQFCDKYQGQWPSESALRAIILDASRAKNNFQTSFTRVGKRVLIDVEEFWRIVYSLKGEFK